MCGIICFLKHSDDEDNIFDILFDQFTHNVTRRGPDSIGKCKQRHGTYTVTFTASVLWLQGSQITRQPVETDKSVFIYNGDIFDPKPSEDGNGDTKRFLQYLEESDNLVADLELICGPYAFMYLDKEACKLYFARDRYGRRSLLIGRHGGSILISSVGVKNGCDFIELPPIGLYVLDLVSGGLGIMPWACKHENYTIKLKEVIACLNTDIETIAASNYCSLSRDYKEPTEDDLKLYCEIESLDAISAFNTILRDNEFLGRVNELLVLLEKSVHLRVLAKPKYCNDCITAKLNCTHSKVGILFSGGLDCTVLALLADKFVDKSSQIDLMNVAFESPANFDTPDRISGRSSLQELRHICPTRKWNFLEINVTNEELNKRRDSHIKHLIYPLNTVLDDSLGCALWFASRCLCEAYESQCRVLLVGMGADELFGGYTRHRTALRRQGWRGLHDGLKEEWQNISHRNLARDDRVVSDHGRQLRTPYLDENVVKYVQGLNVWERTCPSDSLPQGLGDKILLRSLGYKLGLRNAAMLKKRALQFGSRIADKKEKAHEVSPRL